MKPTDLLRVALLSKRAQESDPLAKSLATGNKLTALTPEAKALSKASQKPSSLEQQAATSAPFLNSAGPDPVDPELPPMPTKAPPEQKPVEEPIPDLPVEQVSVAGDPGGFKMPSVGRVGSGKGPDRTITPDQIERQRAYEANKAVANTPADVPAAPPVDDAAARSAVATRTGLRMDPNEEVMGRVDPVTGAGRGPDTALHAPKTTETPPQEPGFMDRLGSGATAAMDWVGKNPGTAAAGVGAVGLLAYLLSKNDEAPQKKKRRRLAAV